MIYPCIEHSVFVDEIDIDGIEISKASIKFQTDLITIVIYELS